jgi:hypothetical protein
MSSAVLAMTMANQTEARIVQVLLNEIRDSSSGGGKEQKSIGNLLECTPAAKPGIVELSGAPALRERV